MTTPSPSARRGRDTAGGTAAQLQQDIRPLAAGLNLSELVLFDLREEGAEIQSAFDPCHRQSGVERSRSRQCIRGVSDDPCIISQKSHPLPVFHG